MKGSEWIGRIRTEEPKKEDPRPIKKSRKTKPTVIEKKARKKRGKDIGRGDSWDAEKLEGADCGALRKVKNRRRKE